MKLTNAYIIDGDVIGEILIDIENSHHSVKPLLHSFSNALKQHLKPALPIVEDAFNSGADIMQDELFVCNGGTDKEELLYSDTTYKKAKQDFLTKDF